MRHITRTSVVCPDSVIDSSVDSHDDTMTAPGGSQLPCNPKGTRFLDVNIVVAALCDKTRDVVDYVPRGVKENVYYIVDNSVNFERRKEGKQSQFWDDRGSWVSGGPSIKTHYICSDNLNMKKVVLKNGVYCFERQRDKKTVFIPVTPQPSPSSVMQIHRYYAKHTVSAKYEKRVTWIGNPDTDDPHRACHEYRGSFPGNAPHGKSGPDKDNYIRTKPATLELIKQKVPSTKPQEIYKELIADDSRLVDGPRIATSP